MNKLAAVLGLLFLVTTWAGPVLLSVSLFPLFHLNQPYIKLATTSSLPSPFTLSPRSHLFSLSLVFPPSILITSLFQDEDKQAKLDNVVLPSLVDDEVLKSVNPYSCLDEYIYDSISELLKVKEES